MYCTHTCILSRRGCRVRRISDGYIDRSNGHKGNMTWSTMVGCLKRITIALQDQILVLYGGSQNSREMRWSYGMYDQQLTLALQQPSSCVTLQRVRNSSTTAGRRGGFDTLRIAFATIFVYLIVELHWVWGICGKIIGWQIYFCLSECIEGWGDCFHCFAFWVWLL